MKKLISLLSMLIVISLAAGAAFAGGPGYGKNRGLGYHTGYSGCDGWGSGINLTQEQKDQLTALRQKFIDDTYASRSTKLEKKQQIRLLMETSNPDRAKLIRLSNDILELDKKITEKKIDYRLAVKKIAPELSRMKGFGSGRHHKKRSFHRGCDADPENEQSDPDEQG